MPCEPSVHKRIAVFAMIVFTSVAAEARQQDVVVMINGDRLTGEVKRLENGVFYFDTEFV